MKMKKNEQENLLLSEQSQQQLLEQELVLRNQILKDIKANESRISKIIDNKKKAHQQLNKAIERIIAAEISNRERINKAPK